MSKNASRGFQSPRLKAFMSKACVRNVLLLVVLSFASASLKAQDVLCFKNLQKEDVIVLSANSDEVSYRKYGDGSGDVHVAKASDLFYVQYQNGKTYRFSDKDENNPLAGVFVPGTRKLITCQFDFLVQDAWGVGLMLRRELNPYVGLNIAGVSYISGWHKYEGPCNMGFINVRALGVRFYTPKVEPCRLYAEITPGYTHSYVDVHYYGSWLKGTGDNFSFDAGAGIEIGKHVALGYHFYYIVGSDSKDGYMHMGKLSILF